MHSGLSYFVSYTVSHQMIAFVKRIALLLNWINMSQFLSYHLIMFLPFTTYILPKFISTSTPGGAYTWMNVGGGVIIGGLGHQSKLHYCEN